MPIGWAQLNKLIGSSYDINVSILYFRQIIMFFVLFSIVSIIYYIIPNAKLRFGSVAPGAFLTIIGWIIAGSVFTWYLRNFNQLNIVYGSLGGIVVSLLFFYVTSMIFVWGAEFNYHFNRLVIKKKIVSIE
jgi:membrane protein